MPEISCEAVVRNAGGLTGWGIPISAWEFGARNDETVKVSKRGRRAVRAVLIGNSERKEKS